MSSQFTIPIKFGPDGCQVNLGDRICRETETLAIIQEFNRTYQAKLREIGNIGGGDNLQRRVNLQQDWIRDLTQQNEMLVKIVESLEKEAADKVALLAKKLETSTLSSEKRIRLLESDVRSLVEVIKRARDENRWSANGLKFFTVNPDTFLLKCECSLIPPTPPERQDNVSLKITDSLHRRVKKGSDSKLRVILEANKNVTELDSKVKDLEKRISESPKQDDLEALQHKLRLKEEEINSVKRVSTEIYDVVHVPPVEELREKVRQLQADYDQVLSELKEKDYLVQKLQLELQVLKEKPKALEKSNSVVVELTEAAGELGRLRKSLQKAQTQYQGACAQLEMKDDVIRDMQKSMDELERRHRECLRESERKDNVINQMQIDMEELREKCKGVERELATGKGVIARLREDAVVQENNCAAEAKVKDEMIRKLKSDVENLKKQLEEATNECESKDGTMAKLRERIRRMEETMDDMENVKISAKKCNVKLQAKTSQRSLKSKCSCRPKSGIAVGSAKKSPGIVRSQVPVLRKPTYGVPKRSSRTVQVDAKSLTSTARKPGAVRSGKSTRCICVETLSKSVGTNREKASRSRKSGPSTRCICVGDLSSSECPSLSARTQTSQKSHDSARSRSPNTRELKKSTPRRKRASNRSPPNYTAIYDIPLSPRPLPPPKPSPPPQPVQRESKPGQFIYLYNRICHQWTRPCSPHYHMVIPNEPKPIAHSPRQCNQAPKLSCNNVLHEHYRISNTSHQSGIVSKFIPNSDRPPIRTFINNLELNIQKQNECKNNRFI